MIAVLGDTRSLREQPTSENQGRDVEKIDASTFAQPFSHVDRDDDQ